jgi:adhesin/invasin
MNKKILFTLSLLSIMVFLSSCGGGGGGGISAAPGTNKGVPSVVKLVNVQNIAQTNSTLFLKAKVLDGSGNPVPNVPVNFTNLSAPFGQLSAAIANTDATGVATVTMQSSLPGFATVLAEINSGAGQVRDRLTVFFTNLIFAVPGIPGPPPPFITLDVDSVPGNNIFNQASDFILFEASGDDTVEVIATVFNGDGSRVGPGESVNWTSDHPEEVVFVRKDSITDGNGQAQAVIKVVPDTLRDTDTHVNIGVSAGNGAASMTTLFLRPVTVNSVVVRATPTIIDPDGTSTITATVTTSTGAPVPDGTMVNFTSTSGVIDIPFAETENGVATTTLKAPTVTVDTTITVTASVGGKTGSVSVSVIAPVTPPEPTPLTLTASASAIDGNAGGTVNFTVSGGATPATYTSTSASPLLAFNDNGAGVGGVANDRVRESGEGGIWTGASFTVTIESCTPGGTVSISATDGTTTVSRTITIQNAAGTTAADRPTMSPATAAINETTAPTSAVFNITQGANAALTSITGTASSTVISLAPAGAQAATSGQVVPFTATASGAITANTTVNLLFTNNLGCKAGGTVTVINQ